MRDASSSEVQGLVSLIADLQSRLAAVERMQHSHATADMLVDHGGLGGLGDNDHPQYLLLTGGTLSGLLIASAGVRTNGSPVLVASDTNHGVKYLGTYDGQALDGPLTFGWARVGFGVGGAAGTMPAYVDYNGLNIRGNRSLLFDAWGGGWYMQDSTWIRATNGKAVYTPNVIAADGGFAAAMGGNMAGQTGITCGGSSMFYEQMRIAKVMTATGGSLPWNLRHLRIESQSGSNPNTASLALWAGGVAPIIQCYNSGSNGEEISFVNNANTGYVNVYALGFIAMSTARQKEDVAPVDDANILERVAKLHAVRWRPKVRPLTLTPSARFAEVADRWAATGRAPLTPQAHHMESADHDCSVHACNGTADDPCAIALNDSPRIGWTAEDVAEVFPEAVQLDADRLPVGVDGLQMAAVTFSAVRALLARVTALEATVESLRAEVAALRS